MLRKVTKGYGRLQKRSIRPGVLIIIGLIFVFANSCAAYEKSEKEKGGVSMKITSPEFENNALIPKKFTCQGEDINPGLIIEDIPDGTKGLALIMDDPDAPMGTWVHWVVFNVPVIDRIEEDSIPGKQGLNDFGRQDYGGPCPPSGTHRYFFKVYAVDTEFDISEGITKGDLEEAMEGHVLDKAELIGLYKKQ